jgi:hypothetical protein
MGVQQLFEGRQSEVSETVLELRNEKLINTTATKHSASLQTGCHENV